MKKIIKSIMSFGLSLAITAGAMPPPAMATGNFESYLDSENLRAYYEALPQSDRTKIAEEMAKQNFSDGTTFRACYEDVFNSVVDLEASGDYVEIIKDDFESGNVSSGWTKNGDDMVEDTDSVSFDGTGTKAYAVYGGRGDGSNTWIKKDIGDRDGVKASLYFYDTLAENTRSGFGIAVADNFIFGVYRGASKYSYSVNTGTDWTETTLTRSEGWHKFTAEFSGTTLKLYLDGTEVYSGTQSFDYLKIGNLWSINGDDYYAVDRVSVIGTRVLSWEEKFNAQTITKDIVKGLLASAQAQVFEQLPECDQNDIVARMEANKPYSSEEQVKAYYKTVLEAVTMYDPQKSGLVFHEGFGESDWYTSWESAKLPSTANPWLGNYTFNLDITGREQKSAVFWGKSVGATNDAQQYVTGDNQNIKRTVPKNSTIVAYFYDVMNADIPYLQFKINEKMAIGMNEWGNYYYTLDSGTSWKDFTTPVTRSKGWHKVVFDGTSTPGKVTGYFDGVAVFTETGETEYIAIGSWEGAGNFNWYCVDNITVSRKFVPVASDVRIVDNNNYITATYNYSHTGSIAEGSPKYQWYKENENNEFVKIEGATGRDYYFEMPEDSNKKFKVSVTPTDINGTVGDEEMSAEFTERYMTGIMPNVTSVTISGTNTVGNTLTATYTATGAGGAGAGTDKYRWYLSDDGSQWTQIEGATGKTYTIEVNAVRAYIKCEVSVAGPEGTYSNWMTSDNNILDNSSIVEMICAVQSFNETGKNALMLKLLGKCDPSFNGYSEELRRKIAVAAITANIQTAADYDALVAGVISGAINVSTDGIDFSNKPIANIGTSGGTIGDITFTDIESVPWAKEAILALRRKGIISGYTETEFAPNGNITRAEFITLLVKTFYELNPSASNSFTDIPAGSWYERYVATAVSEGLASGRSDSTFGPNEPITREEMALFCARVLSAGKCYLNDIKEFTAFVDSNEISEYAYDSVVSVFKKGIMSGVGENFFIPRGNATRAMAAQVIYLMLGKPQGDTEQDMSGVVFENFENGSTGIFQNGYADMSDVGALKLGNTAYSGTTSVIFRGKAAATVSAGDNRYFRIMFYDANGPMDGVDGCLIVEGDKETYSIGANTGKGAYNYGLYYQCRVGDTWYETGMIKTVGWHEFAIDMSTPGKVDMYMDGLLVKSFADEGTIPERVVIGNLNDGIYGKYNCYGDDFAMAKDKKTFEAYMSSTSITGNALIGSVAVDISTLADNVKDKARLLNSLSILPISTGGGELPQDTVTREELAYLLSGMQNVSAAHKKAAKQNFSDVAVDRWSAGYIADAVEKGFITAEDKYFMPEEDAKTIDALRAALVLLGYGDVISGDKDAIISAATAAEITDGVLGKENLTWEAAIRLMTNVLEARVLGVTLKTSISFSQSDVSYMNYKFDLYEIKDIVNGVYGGEFTSETQLAYDEMLIGNYLIKTDNKSVREYLGTEVKAYIYADKDTDENTLLYITDNGKSKVIAIRARDVLEAKNNQLAYAESNRRKTVKLSKTLKVIKNGEYLFGYTDSDFMFDIGTVRLIDGQGDGTYECAVIENYVPIKVGGYDTNAQTMRDEYSESFFSLSEAEMVTEAYSKKAYPESFEIGDVVLAAISDSGKFADFIKATDSIQGTITKFDGEYVYINSEEYEVAKAFENFVNRKSNGLLDAGCEAVFLLDTFGNIVGVESHVASGSVYAFISKIWLDDVEDVVRMKLFTDKGSFITVEADPKIKINNVKSEPEKLLELKPQLIRYALSGKTLKSIELADESHKRTQAFMGDDTLKGSDKFWLYYSGDINFWDWYHFGTVIDTTNSPKMIIVPEEGKENEEDGYQLSSFGEEFENNATYNIMAYDADEFNRVQIMVYRPKSALNDNPDPHKNVVDTRVFVVEKLTTELNEDGDVVQILHGWEGGAKKAYEVAKDIDFNEYKRNNVGYSTDWKFGDCLIIGYNRKEKVNGAWIPKKVVTDIVTYHTPDEADKRMYVYSDGESPYTVFARNFGSDYYAPEYAAFWFGKILSAGDSGIIVEGRDGTRLITQKAWFTTLVVNRSDKTVEIGSAADLVPGREVYAYVYHGKPYDLVVFVD